jgi:hypothetical protein
MVRCVVCVVEFWLYKYEAEVLIVYQDEYIEGTFCASAQNSELNRLNSKPMANRYSGKERKIVQSHHLPTPMIISQ